MPYIGNPIYQAAFVTDQFSGDGTTTAFTMSVAPAGVSNVLVVVSGVVQDPSTYGVSGNTLTFSAAPPSGTGNISCRYLGIPVTGVVTTAYRTVTEFTATASQTTFTPPSYTVGYINVYRNGVLLGSADYTATNGTTVVLTTGATAGDLVTTESFYVSSVLNAIPNSPASVGTSNLVDASVTSAKLAAAAALNNFASASSTTYNAQYLIVAGGGGGGSKNGGGGGGGGVLQGLTTLTSGTGYTITVGAGGTKPAAGGNNYGGNGGNSSAFSLTAIGGGGGSGQNPSAANAGGSGGGAGANNSSGYSIPGAGTAGQGNQGGGSYGRNTPPAANDAGGGGGGAAGPGVIGNSYACGNGGPGVLSMISGSAAYYGGGGGGGGYNASAPGYGGIGGGGAGCVGASGVTSPTAVAGTANTGGGGGGGNEEGQSTAMAAAGGTGIVIVAYPGAQRGTGGTITSVGGNTIHTFTSSGTYTA